MNSVTRRIIALLPAAFLVFFVILCSWVLYWTIDGVYYQFVYKGPPTSFFSWEPIRDLDGVWRSITAHYIEVNGRFFCHLIVILICSFVPQWLFALLNGGVIATLLYLLCKESGIKSSSIGGVWSVTFMSWIAFDNPNDPAFYVNYIWMGTLVVGWIMMFVRHPQVKPRNLIWVGLFSILAGQSHECLALPVGLALVAYLIENKGKVRTFDWVAGLCFCLSGVSTIISPGFFSRFGDTVEYGYFGISRYNVFSNLFLPCLLLWALWRYRKQVKAFFSGKRNVNRFWLWVFIGNIILALATLSRYGTRAFTIGSAAAIILSLRLIPRHRLNNFWMTVMMLMTAWVIWMRAYYTFGLTSKYEYAEEVYLTTRPDTVWVPDKLFMHESRLTEKMNEYIVRRAYKATGTKTDSVPSLFTILPESLKDVPRDFDGNICKKLDRNVYLLVQSKKNPARFVSHKRLYHEMLPFDILPLRELIFADNSDEFDIFVDSTATWRAAFYTQEYIPYLDFVVEIDSLTNN